MARTEIQTDTQFLGPFPMSLVRISLLTFLVVLGAATLLLFGVNDNAGMMLFFYMVFMMSVVVYFRSSFNLLTFAISVVPTLNIFFEPFILKAILLILPFFLTFHYKRYLEGCRTIFSRKDAIFYGIMLMVAGALVSTANSVIRGTFDRDMVLQVSLLAYGIAFLLLVVTLINSKKALIKAINALLVPAIALIVLMLFYFMFSNITAVYHSVKGKNLEIGEKLIHANLIAMIIMPIMIVTFPVVLRKRTSLTALIYYMAFPLSIVSIILTSSRGAWLGFAFGVGYIFTRIRKVKYMIMMLAIVVIVGAMFGTYVIRRYSQTNKFDAAILERYVLWEAAMKYVTTSPLVGLGPNYFRIEKYKLGVPANVGPANAYSTHNILLELAVNYSCITLVGFLMLFIYAFYRVDKTFIQSDKQDSDNYYLLSLNAAALATMVHSFFDCNIANISFMTILNLFLGIYILVIRKPNILGTP